MFERFAKEARRTVVLAQELARSRGDGRIGSEHLLISCFETTSRETLGLSSTILREALTSLDQAALRAVGVETEVIGAFAVSKSTKEPRHIPFTGSAKETLQNALSEAIALNDRQIGSDHILLGITRLPDTDRAIRLLQSLDVGAADLRVALLDQDLEVS